MGNSLLGLNLLISYAYMYFINCFSKIPRADQAGGGGGGRGSGPPNPGNPQVTIGFLRNTGTDHLRRRYIWSSVKFTNYKKEKKKKTKLPYPK